MTDKPDLDHLRQWIGRTQEASDIVTAQLVKGLRATLFMEIGTPKPGDAAPFTVHWCLAQPVYPMSELGPDGHPKTRRLSAACSPAAPDVGRRAVRIPPAFAHRRIHRAQGHDRGCVGIRGMTLRYNHEVRDEASYFAEIPELKLPEEILRVAEHIVETKMSDFDPAFLEDRYRTVLISKLKEKRAELPRRAVVAAPSAQNVISLMDVLKRSLAAEQPVARTLPTKPATRRRAAPSGGSSSKRSSARV